MVELTHLVIVTSNIILHTFNCKISFLLHKMQKILPTLETIELKGMSHVSKVYCKAQQCSAQN